MFLTEIEEYLDNATHNSDSGHIDYLDDVDDADCDDLGYEPEEKDLTNSAC